MATGDQCRTINLDCLEIGQVVYVTYISPNKGTIQINFIGVDPQNIIFHTSIRYDNGDLVLNTLKQIEGCWGPEERPKGFLFAHECSIQLRYEIRADGFNVSWNGNCLAFYQHRLPVGSIKSIEYRFNDNGSVKAKLQAIDIKY